MEGMHKMANGHMMNNAEMEKMKKKQMRKPSSKNYSRDAIMMARKQMIRK